MWDREKGLPETDITVFSMFNSELRRLLRLCLSHLPIMD